MSVFSDVRKVKHRSFHISTLCRQACMWVRFFFFFLFRTWSARGEFSPLLLKPNTPCTSEPVHSMFLPGPTNYSSRKGLLQPNNFPRSVRSFFAHLCLPLPRETRRQEGCSWKQVKHNKAFRKCGCLENRCLGVQLHSAVYWLQKISSTQPRKLPWLQILSIGLTHNKSRDVVI